MASHNHKAIAANGAYADAIIRANHESGLHDLPLACALVEQESGFKNIFGCDYGPQGGNAPWCNEKVTEARVKALYRSGRPNGVGLTQLTSTEYVKQADAQGGSWKAYPNCFVGFRLLHQLIESTDSLRVGIGAYNGGLGNPQMGYAAEVLARRNKWQPRLR